MSSSQDSIGDPIDNVGSNQSAQNMNDCASKSSIKATPDVDSMEIDEMNYKSVQL